MPHKNYIKSTSQGEYRLLEAHYITSDDTNELKLSRCEMFAVVYNSKKKAIRVVCCLGLTSSTYRIDIAISTSS